MGGWDTFWSQCITFEAIIRFVDVYIRLGCVLKRCYTRNGSFVKYNFLLKRPVESVYISDKFTFFRLVCIGN